MSEIIGTIKLTSAISPTDTLDTYAVTIEDYNQGGYRSVADQAEREAITDARRKEGMLVKQLDDDTYWTLTGGIDNVNWLEANIGGAGDPWVSIDQNTLAVEGDRFLADTTTGAFTVTLPLTPELNDRIAIVPLYPTYDVNPLTVDGNGANIMGSATDLIINQLGVAVELFYVDATVGWAVIRQGDVGIINNIDDSGVSIYIELTDTGIGHTHSATVTFAQLSDLLEGNVSSVVVPSSTNAGHSHNVTVEYNNGAIEITNIAANHVGQPHGSRILNGPPILEPWEVITTNYLASASDRLLADSTLGVFNITLPATPEINSKVSIAPLRPTYDTNPVTVLRNGELINGTTDDVLLNQLGLSVELFFVGGTVGWALISKGETTIINNIIVDNGVIVATQPGVNTFTNTNTFSADISVPTPTVDAHAATKLYVDTEIANNVPSGLALLTGGNVYVSGTQDFTSAPLLIQAPSVNANPATKLYVDTEISNNVPTGVAILADANTFTNTNTFSGTTNLNGTTNFAGNMNATGFFNLDFNRTSGARLQLGTQTTHDGFLNINTVASSVNAFKVDYSNPNDIITIGDPLISIMDIYADVITIDATTSVEVQSPFNIDVANGGEFNIVDVAGSTLVLQAGSDFEIGSIGGSLWVQGLRFPNADGLAGEVLKTNGDGSLEFGTGFDIDSDQVITSEWAFELSAGKHFIVTDEATLTTNDYVSGFFDRDTHADVNSYVHKTEIAYAPELTSAKFEMVVPTNSDQVTSQWEIASNAGTANITLSTDISNNSRIDLSAERITVSQDPIDPLDVATKQFVDPDIVYVTATSYTVTAADHRKTIELDNASTITLTINSGLGPNFSFSVIQGGDGKVVWGGTATVNNVDSHVRTRGKYALATFVSRLNGIFVVGGATEI